MINTENNIKHFIHVLNVYAKSKGWKLSPYAEKIVTRSVNMCNGFCPCSYERGFCPCKEHESEVELNGSCHCTLFTKE